MKACRTHTQTQHYRYFDSLPTELVVHILTGCKLQKGNSSIAPQYLSKIAVVCKVWNTLIHDITFKLLNEGKIRLVHIPFICRERKNSYTRASHISKYLKFLNANLSLQEIEKIASGHSTPLLANDFFYEKRTLTYLDLSDLRNFDKTLLETINPLFENFQTLFKDQCSNNETFILPKFTQLHRLNITPTANTDLKFIQTLKKLESLSLHFLSQPILTNALETLSKINTISILTLNSRASSCLKFTDNFRLPDQINQLALTGFEFTSTILNESSLISRIDLKNTFLKKPASFSNLKNLKYLSIHIRENIRDLTLKNLKLDYFELTSSYLQKLIIYDCNLKNFENNCPLVEKATYLSSGRYG